MNPEKEDRAAGREESARAYKESQEAKKAASIKGFIKITIEKDEITLAVKSITGITNDPGDNMVYGKYGCVIATRTNVYVPSENTAMNMLRPIESYAEILARIEAA